MKKIQYNYFQNFFRKLFHKFEVLQFFLSSSDFCCIQEKIITIYLLHY